MVEIQCMRIGDSENFLSIDSVPLDAGHALLKIEVSATASGCRFNAFHDRVVIDSSNSVQERFANFASLNTMEFETFLSEGGWLRLKRDSRGYVTVAYRVAGWKASAAMEGEIIVEGEFSGKLCRDLAVLLRDSS
jgi:hypothetical protein